MTYDIIISALAIIGIAAVVVSSYKMAHSRVYPVGVIHRSVDTRKMIDSGATERTKNDGQTEKEVKVKSRAGKYFTYTNEMWQCEECGLVQPFGEDRHCKNCKHHMTSEPCSEILENEGTEAGMPDNSVFDRVTKLDQKLSSHVKSIHDLEKRLRRLEVESFRKLQSTGEETAQPTREEIIH